MFIKITSKFSFKKLILLLDRWHLHILSSFLISTHSWICLMASIASYRVDFLLTHFYDLLFFKYVNNFLLKFNFLDRYYSLNNFLWSDGLLVDSLQKLHFNNVIRNFFIVSSILFNDKILFTNIINLPYNFFVKPLYLFYYFEFFNIGWLFFFIFYILILFILFIAFLLFFL